MKRFKENVVVDLAIASTFARELTQEQFGPSRRTPRRAQATGRTTETPHLDARPDARGHGASTSAPFATHEDRRRLTATPIVRVLSRLVQAR
jgi:hypothetical protein